MRVYLAGPDVFMPDPWRRAADLKAVCARYGLVGVSPLDPAERSATAASEAFRIFAQNEAHMRSSDVLIANLTPFRGPSADAGTVFEVGFMHALGRPVFGWSNSARGLTERTLDLLRGRARRDAGGTWRDAEEMAIEAFGLADNLMIDGAVAASGGTLVVEEVPVRRRWTDLAAFERCVTAVARLR